MICGIGGHRQRLLKSAAGATTQVCYVTALVFLSASGKNTLGDQKCSVFKNSLHDLALIKFTSVASSVQVVS